MKKKSKTVLVRCLYCEDMINMPKVRGVDYTLYPVVHKKHKMKIKEIV